MSASRHAGDPKTTQTSEIEQRLREILARGSAVVCVGHELRGDDAGGCALARLLAPYELPWSLYDARHAPESYLMKIVAPKPPSVLVIDAVAFDAPPGAMRIFPAEAIVGQGPSTHGPGSRAFLTALKLMHPCPCFVLGIRPGQTNVGTTIAPAVAAAVADLARILLDLASGP